MHAILVTFRPNATEQEIMGAFGPKMMEAMPKTQGLVMKTLFEEDPQTWGGFYIFDSKDNADAYLAGEFFTEFSGSSLLSDFVVRHFEVDDHPSQAFGTPTTPLSKASAA